jgi:hypothetical protein
MYNKFNYIKKENKIKGYKIFEKINGRLVCRDFRFDETKTNRIDKNIPIKLCRTGFHFCKDLINCFRYYTLTSKHVVCEVTGYGDCDKEYYDMKNSVRCLDIVRVIPIEEVYQMLGIDSSSFGKVVEKRVRVNIGYDRKKYFRSVISGRFERAMNSEGISVKGLNDNDLVLADVKISKPSMTFEGITKFNDGYGKILKLKYKLEQI